MKKFILLLTQLVIFLAAAQASGVYVNNIKLINKYEQWCWSIAQDQNNNMLFGVERGIIVYDGVNEKLIETESTPLDIVVDTTTNNIWLCGNGYIGVLNETKPTNYNYTTLEERPDDEFNKIVVCNGKVYFITKTRVVIYNASKLNKEKEVITDDLLIENVFIYNNQVHFLIDYFLHTIKDDKFIEQTSYNLPVDEFSYIIPIDNKLILGSLNGTTYSYNGKTLKTFEIKSPFYDNNVITNAKLLNNNTILLSSIAGGIAMLNLNNHKIEKQINYFNGLPDDEIRASFIDNQRGIWLSHEFGISYINTNLGINSYSYYPGLKGNPLAIKNFNNNIYVATNDGLFMLDVIKDYNEFTVKINIPVDVEVSVPSIKKQDVNADEDDNVKKGLFGRILRSNEDNKSNNTDNKDVTKKTINKTKLIKKRSLKSISQYFVMVEGMRGKYTQLLNYKNILLVAGNNGLFAVDGKTSEPVLKNLYINDLYVDKSGDKVYCATNDGVYRVYLKGDNKWEIDHFAETTSAIINSITEDTEGNWLIASENIILKAKFKYNDIEPIEKIILPENPGRTFVVKLVNDSIYVFDSKTIFQLTNENKLIKIQELNIKNYLINNQYNYTWLFNTDKWFLYANTKLHPNKQIIDKLNLFGSLRYIDIDTDGNIWLINDSNELYKLESTKEGQKNGLVSNIYTIKSGEKTIEFDYKVNLNSRSNNLKVTLSAPFYLVQDGVWFSYLIEGLNSKWSAWTKSSELILGHIPPGSYNLKFKARNAIGKESEIKSIAIEVPKPFTQSLLFFGLILIVFVIVTYFIFKWRLKKLQRDKQILEEKVKERTKTITEQKAHIEKQHEEITGSIRYAQRIQKAMLPHDEIIEAMIPDHFILFKPRDIVSGDFYFFKPVGDKAVFVAADCTGHGVPGGFMSMVGMSFLGEITSVLPTPTASEIIDHLREKIKITLGQNEADSTQKDGMDLAICVIDFHKKQIQFSGAFNPLFIIRDGELDVVKADRQPVAVYIKESEFTNHVIDVKPGDSFYMFSDGFPDQIGGEKQRKFMTKNFKNLLLKNHKLPMQEQCTVLEKALFDWKGDTMQVDDVLVVGFRI